MSLKTRLLGVVAAYGFTIAVVFMIVGLLAIGLAGQTYMTPRTTTVTEERNQQTLQTAVHTSAVATNNSTLYEEGRVLRDMPVYFTNGTPNLTYHVKTTAPSGTQVEVDTRLVLHLSASRGGQVFWQQRQVLVTDTDTVTDGTAWANNTVAMRDIMDKLATKQSHVSGVGQFDAAIALQTTYQTPEYEGTLTANTSLFTTGKAYWLESHPTASETHSETDVRRVQQPRDLEQIGLYAIIGIACIALGVLSLRTYWSIDRERLMTERSREQYADWISSGEIPTKSEKEYVRVDSLADLVDIAIDSNKRVIHDSELDAYGVVEADIVYYYTTGDEDLTDWLDI